MGDKVDFQFLLWFDLPGDVMFSRLMYRASQSKVKRSDDNKDTMLKRIKTFENSIPLFDRYREANQLSQINAIGGKEEIFWDVENAFDKAGLIDLQRKPQVIFVMGGPGAGKGTQCGKLLAKYPQLDSFSTGDLLRAKKKENTPEARALAQTMAEGKLVTSATVVKLMREYMDNSKSNIFLADGFPRSQENIDEWNKQLHDKVEVRFLLLFDLDADTMLKRLLYRASQSKVKRDDDKEPVMRKRIATFEASRPIFASFKQKGLYQPIDASQTIEEIYENVVEAFSNKGII